MVDSWRWSTSVWRQADGESPESASLITASPRATAATPHASRNTDMAGDADKAAKLEAFLASNVEEGGRTVRGGEGREEERWGGREG